MMPPMLVRLARDFEVSIAVAGQMASLVYLAWAIAAPLAGPLSDAYGRRAVYLGGLTLLGVGALLAAFAWSLPVLAVGCLLMGMGGVVGPMGNALLGDQVPSPRLGKAIAIVYGSGNLGTLLMVPAAAVLAATLGWRWAFGAVALISLPMVAAFLRTFPHPAPVTEHSLRLVERVRGVLAQPVTVCILAVNGLVGLAFLAVFTYLSAHLVRNLGLSTGQTALPMAVITTAMVTGSWLGGELSRRPDRLHLMAVSLVLSGIAAAMVFLVPSVLAAVVLAFLFILGMWVALPTLTALTMVWAGAQRGTAVGMYSAVWQVGSMAGVFLGGLVLDGAGYGALGLLGLLATWSAALVLGLLVHELAPAAARRDAHTARLAH